MAQRERTRIALDIETAPLPYADGEAPVFEPQEFDPAAVKVGNLKDQDKIAAKIADAEAGHEAAEVAREMAWKEEQDAAFKSRALSPYTGQITCICLCNDEVSIPLYIGNGADMDDEESILRTFWGIWPEYDQIITYNGYSFDMQYIIIRSMILGIPAPYLRARGNKYIRDINLDRHIDLINLFDAKGKWQGLSTVAQAILGADKTGTGTDAIDLFLAGKHKELAEYCMNDAKLTWELWKRIGGE